MKEELQIGDKVLAKELIGSIFHAKIIHIKKGWLWNVYYARWTVNDGEEKYETGGALHSWNIICKN